MNESGESLIDYWKKLAIERGDEITTLKDREKKLAEVVEELLTGIEHAIDLEYLGEVSTNKMNIDFVKNSREVLKTLGVEL